MLKGESQVLIQEVHDVLERGHTYQSTVVDNGAKPFTFLLFYDKEEELLSVDVAVTETSEIFYSSYLDEVWLGSGQYDDTQDLSYKHFKCNTVLFVMGQNCTWLGAECVGFKLKEGESVVRFVSTVENSCCPYGWTETTTSYIGLESLSCENYRIEKSPEVEEMILNGELNLKCPPPGAPYLKEFKPFVVHRRL